MKNTIRLDWKELADIYYQMCKVIGIAPKNDLTHEDLTLVKDLIESCPFGECFEGVR